jgi:2,3-bisphosphoglycerate-independent phosphoglycerate mutase
MKKTVVLCVLDGFGCAKDGPQNALTQAHMPHWSALWKEFPHTLLQASDHFVGLPDGQMGNSEVGHMTIGAGRVILQDLPRVSHAFASGAITGHQTLNEAIARLKETGGVFHVAGLLSPGGVHSHMDHLKALTAYLTSQGVKVALHAFLDGRDTPPQSALGYLREFLPFLKECPGATLATLGGRYFGMDRDKRWDRVEKAYQVLLGKAPATSLSPEAYIAQQYEQEISDEFIPPMAFGAYDGIKASDAFVMVNFRADRVRQLLSALFVEDFSGFERSAPLHLVGQFGMSSYSATLDGVLATLVTNENVEESVGEVISKAGMTQLRLAETEKYAHVTFFFNGGREDPFSGEDRHLIPSPQVATYDLQPEMSAPEVTDYLCEAITSNRYDLIVVNYANTDMVGHTGKMEAAIKALETVDAALGRVSAAVKEVSGILIITSDHGNVEDMGDHSHPHTAHTVNPVPFVIVGAGDVALNAGGLSDVAPTILTLLGLTPPKVMTGTPLIENASCQKAM